MQSARNSGGPAHIRYGLNSRPRLIEVVCPSCGKLAQARKESEKELKSEVVSDLSPSFLINDWEVTCLHCPKRISDKPYDELPERFYSGEKSDVWAWNTDHANCMINYLAGKETSKNPYNWFMTYVPGDWKKDADKVIAELKALLEKT